MSTVDCIVPGQKLVLRSYYDADCTFITYQNMVHDGHDREIAQFNKFQKLFEAAGVSDGDEFEIVIVKTGRRPFGDTKYVFQGHNHYGPETPDQTRERQLKKSRR